jgi:hypothetical protein
VVEPELSKDTAAQSDEPPAPSSDRPTTTESIAPNQEYLGFLTKAGGVPKAVMEPLTAVEGNDVITGTIKITALEMRPRSKPTTELGKHYFALKSEGVFSGELFCILPETTPLKSGDSYKVSIIGRVRSGGAGPAPYITEIVEHIPAVAPSPEAMD